MSRFAAGTYVGRQLEPRKLDRYFENSALIKTLHNVSFADGGVCCRFIELVHPVVDEAARCSSLASTSHSQVDGLGGTPNINIVCTDKCPGLTSNVSTKRHGMDQGLPWSGSRIVISSIAMWGSIEMGPDSRKSRRPSSVNFEFLVRNWLLAHQKLDVHHPLYQRRSRTWRGRNSRMEAAQPLCDTFHLVQEAQANCSDFLGLVACPPLTHYIVDVSNARKGAV
jgi:hypothetical protein